MWYNWLQGHSFDLKGGVDYFRIFKVDKNDLLWTRVVFALSDSHFYLTTSFWFHFSFLILLKLLQKLWKQENTSSPQKHFGDTKLPEMIITTTIIGVTIVNGCICSKKYEIIEKTSLCPLNTIWTTIISTLKRGKGAATIKSDWLLLEDYMVMIVTASIKLYSFCKYIKIIFQLSFIF